MRWTAKLKSFVEDKLTEITILIMVVMSISGEKIWECLLI